MSTPEETGWLALRARMLAAGVPPEELDELRTIYLNALEGKVA